MNLNPRMKRQVEEKKKDVDDGVDLGVIVDGLNDSNWLPKDVIRIIKIKLRMLELKDIIKGKKGIWIVGPEGSGKTRIVQETWINYYNKSCNGWWDGYQGEEIVLIDDLDKTHKYLGRFIMRWVDKFSFLVEGKGTITQINPKKIVITSNYSIEEIFDDINLQLAILRRFNVIKFNEIQCLIPDIYK